MRGTRIGIDVGMVVVWWLVAFAASAVTLLGTERSGLALLPMDPFHWSTLLVGPGVAGGVVGLVLWRTGGTWVDVVVVVVLTSVVVGAVGWWRHQGEALPGYLADDRVVAFQLVLFVVGSAVGLVLGVLAVRGLPSAVPAMALAAWWLGVWSVVVVLESTRLLSDSPYGGVRSEPVVAGRSLSWVVAAVALVAVGVLAGRAGAWLWAAVGAALVLAAEIGVVSVANVAVLVQPGAGGYVVGEAVDRVTQILPAFLRMSYPWEPLGVLAVGVVIGLVRARVGRTEAGLAPRDDDEPVPTDAA